MLALKRSFLCPRLLVLSAGQLHVHSSAPLKCSPFSFLLPDGHHLSPRFIGFPSRLPESTCQRIIFVKCQPDLVLSLSVAFSDPLWPSAGSSQSLKSLVRPSPVLLGAVASHLSAPPFPQPSPSFSCLTPTQPLRVSSEAPFWQASLAHRLPWPAPPCLRLRSNITVVTLPLIFRVQWPLEL